MRGDGLPKGWRWVELADVAEIVTGNTPPTSDEDNYGGNLPFVKPPQLNGGFLSETPESLSPKGAQLARVLPEKSVLVSCIGILGKTAITNVRCATNQQINAIVFLPDVLPEYGFYYAQTLSEWLTSNSAATTVSIINKGKFEKAPFPLSSTAEQSRIVAKLEALLSDLDAGVAELKAAQKKLTQYRQSLLKAAVEGALTAEWRAKNKPKETGAQLLARILKERRARWEAKQLAKFAEQGKTPPKDWKDKYVEPVKPDTEGLPELPQGWVWASVDLAGDVQLGRQRAPQYHTGSNMVPYLRVANVFENRIDTSDVMQMHFSEEEERIFTLHPNDILLNEGQSLELIGRPAIYRGELPKACFTNTLVRFRCEASVLPEFALAVFLHYMHSGRFQKIAKITTNIAHLGAGRFAELEFPLPSVNEQKEILAQLSEHLDQHKELLDSIRIELKQSSAQRQNILRAAFSGQLVPQDPNDEPASVLLERIRADRAERESSIGKAKGRKTRIVASAQSARTHRVGRPRKQSA